MPLHTQFPMTFMMSISAVLQATFNVADATLSNGQVLGKVEGVKIGELTVSDINSKGVTIVSGALRLNGS